MLPAITVEPTELLADWISTLEIENTVEYKDEDQVQHDVDKARDQKEIQRALRIAYRAQNGRAEIVEHHRRHADEIDAHVERRLTEHVVRRAHQREQWLGEQQADYDQHRAAHEACEHRSVHRIMQLLAVARAVIARDQHVCADGKTDKHVDQQVDQRAGGTHRRQRRMADELPDDDNIRRVEKKLQHARKHQRNRKAQDLAEKRAVAHIDFIAAARALAPAQADLQAEHHNLYFSFHVHGVNTPAPLRPK